MELLSGIYFENYNRDFTSSQQNDERFNYDEAQYHIIETAVYPNAKRTFFDTWNDEWPSAYTQFVFFILMERNGSFYTHLFVTPLFGDAKHNFQLTS